MNSAQPASSVYEQVWLHARHTEIERLWLTNVYAIVSAGLVGFMASAELEHLWAVPAFAVVYSVVMLLMTSAVRVEYLRFSRLAEVVLHIELKMPQYRRFLAGDDADSLDDVGGKPWSMHRTFVSLYVLATAAW